MSLPSGTAAIVLLRTSTWTRRSRSCASSPASWAYPPTRLTSLKDTSTLSMQTAAAISTRRSSGTCCTSAARFPNTSAFRSAGSDRCGCRRTLTAAGRLISRSSWSSASSTSRRTAAATPTASRAGTPRGPARPPPAGRAAAPRGDAGGLGRAGAQHPDDTGRRCSRLFFRPCFPAGPRALPYIGCACEGSASSHAPPRWGRG
mmetsp:Transcript_30895/g.82721  ORF Transcript_30895/g.82721 Transcript_30895/m.82721 type:complete len:203 (+) Transcript_30895:70-678(+)